MFIMTSLEINSDKFLPFNWCSLVFLCHITDILMINQMTVVVVPEFYTFAEILVTFSSRLDDFEISKCGRWSY